MCFDLEEGPSLSEIGGDTLVGRGMHFDLATHATEWNIVGVASFCACANPLTTLSKIFMLCGGGAEHVLGSRSLENELFRTTVNVLVVSSIIQRCNNCMCYKLFIHVQNVRTNKLPALM